jgi:hypothetical protein
LIRSERFIIPLSKANNVCAIISYLMWCWRKTMQRFDGLVLIMPINMAQSSERKSFADLHGTTSAEVRYMSLLTELMNLGLAAKDTL